MKIHLKNYNLLMYRHVLLLFLLLSTGLAVKATTYYVSNKGNDSNNGKSQAFAFKTLERLRSLVFLPGDSVLFKKGDIFYGELKIKYSGSPNKPIVFSSYGFGGQPVFTGAMAQQITTSRSDKVLVFKVSERPSQVYIDNELMTIARFPNNGFLSIDSTSNTVELFDEELQQRPGYWIGANARVRTSDWTYETRVVNASSKGKLLFDISTRYNFKKDFGYYLDNKKELLDTANEWYYDAKSGLVQIILPAKFNQQSKINAVLLRTGISFEPHINNVEITGIHVDKFSEHGLYGFSNKKIRLVGNTFTNCYKSGITLDGTECNGNIISDNQLRNIAGIGIVARMPANSIVSDNQLDNIGLIAGYGTDGVWNGNGILVDGGSYNEVKYNKIDSTGQNGIRLDGNNNWCEGNVIKNVQLRYKDGGGIDCWGANAGNTFNNTIINNIVMNIYSTLEACPPTSTWVLCHGIYMDSRSNGMTIKGNTVINSRESGFLVNDTSYNHVFENNTTFNCESGMLFDEYKFKGALHGNRITNNLFYSNKPDQFGINIWARNQPEINVGRFADNKYYVLPQTGYVIKRRTKPNALSVETKTEKLTVSDWQRMGEDHGSQQLKASERAEIFWNEDKVEKVIPVGTKSYRDLNGNYVRGSVKLNPFQSIILVPAD